MATGARRAAHRSIFDEVSRCAARLLAELLDPLELLLFGERTHHAMHRQAAAAALTVIRRRREHRMSEVDGGSDADVQPFGARKQRPSFLAHQPDEVWTPQQGTH